MHFSISSLIRLIVILALVTTMTALGLARVVPERAAFRSRRPVQQFNINEYFLDVADRTPRWLDGETGQVSAHPLADGDVLEAASCAPWVDEHGRGQIVGRWSNRTMDGPMSMSNDFGLARYTFPGGEKLDQVSTETVPIGPPCWFPGTAAKVLFTAGDGRLYRFAFESDSPVKSNTRDESGRDLKPSRVAWRCKMPGEGNVFISDLSWPDDPRLDGRLLVTLRQQELDADGSRCYSRTQLWWLKLNHAGTEVVEAGRMVVPEPGSEQVDERSPTLATLPDGRMLLAYLRQNRDGLGWQARLAPIEIDSVHQHFRAFEASSRLVANRCQPVHPVFSLDGQWLCAVIGQSATEGKVGRFSTSRSVATPRS